MITFEQAGKQRRADSDQIGRFIGDRCVVGEYCQAKASQLYAAYREWTENNGEHAISNNQFAPRIEEKFSKDKTEHGNVYRGIGLSG